MRQIVLDTETTGLDPAQGHRIIEVAGVEIVDRRLTRKHFHKYLNPQRDIDEAAIAVHGLTTEFLADKPLFADIADELREFIADAELVIHNAAFDVGFLDAEFGKLGMMPTQAHCAGVLDTLKLARELHPGKRNSLDALCDRYEIDNAHRTLHGALLDAELLAEVYLSMTRGQETLLIDVAPATTPAASGPVIASGPRHPLRVLAAEEADLAAHNDYLADLDKASGGKCVWKALQPAPEPAA